MEIHAITHFLFKCKAEGGREYVLLHRGLKYILRLFRKTRVLHGKQQQQLFCEIQYIELLTALAKAGNRKYVYNDRTINDEV